MGHHCDGDGQWVIHDRPRLCSKPKEHSTLSWHQSGTLQILSLSLMASISLRNKNKNRNRISKGNLEWLMLLFWDYISIMCWGLFLHFVLQWVIRRLLWKLYRRKKKKIGFWASMIISVQLSAFIFSLFVLGLITRSLMHTYEFIPMNKLWVNLFDREFNKVIFSTLVK